ncbi:MAG: hypothetical protein AAGA48_34085 [Myxococcota bacterium]
MVAQPRDPFGGPSSVPWRSSFEVFAVQMFTVAVGIVLMLATPMGLSPLFGWVAGAMLFGAWAWAVRVGKPQGLLVRAALRIVAQRTAVLGGIAVALSYVGVALIPGQLALPWYAVGLVAPMLGLGGGFASLVLTLCGLDVARSNDATSQRDS